VLVLVVACFLGGWAARGRVPRTAEAAALLDRYVLAVALPALILAKLPGVALGAAVAVPVAVAWGGLAVAVAVVAVASRAHRWDRHETGALLLVTPLGNTSFLGLAAVEVLLGADHLGPALAFDQLGSFLGLAAYGALVASRFGGGAPGWRPAVRRLLRFAPFLALLASIPLRWVELPGAVDTVFGGVGRTVAPVAMLALGLRFRLVLRRRVLAPAAWCLGTKMVLLPALALLVATVAGATGRTAWQAAVLQSGMPPMVTAGVVAVQAGLDEELATFVVGVGTLLAFATLPLLASLLG
jgi:predicted permease